VLRTNTQQFRTERLRPPCLMKRTLSCSVPSQFLFVVINNYIKTCLTNLIRFTTIHVVFRLISENRRFNYNDHNFRLLSCHFPRVVIGEQCHCSPYILHGAEYLIWVTTIHVVFRLISENRRFNYNDRTNFRLLSCHFPRVVTGE